MVVKDAIVEEYSRSEWFLSYYDIFIRNAFGNYRDILREISYNPLMAENLSFLGSKSSAYMLERFRVKTSAGEILYMFFTVFIQINCLANFSMEHNFVSFLSYRRKLCAGNYAIVFNGPYSDKHGWFK